MANIHIHGDLTVRCDCGWFLDDRLRPKPGESIIVKCPHCNKKYKVSLVLEELPPEP